MCKTIAVECIYSIEINACSWGLFIELKNGIRAIAEC
jgi:hypothetical protein